MANIMHAVMHIETGKVAKSLALSNPDRVAGLVVLDIAPVKYTNKDPMWKAVVGIINSLKDVELPPGKTKRDVDVELRTSVEDPAIRAFVLTNLETIPSKDKVQTLRWKINVDAIADQLHRIAAFDVKSMELTEESELDLQYSGDTFLIKGGASSFVKNAHIPLIKKHFPNFMLTSVKGCGHWVHAESPDQTVALLKKYLDR
jgi:esterase